MQDLQDEGGEKQTRCPDTSGLLFLFSSILHILLYPVFHFGPQQSELCNDLNNNNDGNYEGKNQDGRSHILPSCYLLLVVVGAGTVILAWDFNFAESKIFHIKLCARLEDVLKKPHSTARRVINNHAQ